MELEDAVKVAIEKVKSLFGGSEHRLEEIETKSNGDWEVTVSYRSPDSPGIYKLQGTGFLAEVHGSNRAAIGVDVSRVYKDVEIAKTGEVKAVRMRQIVVG